MISVEPLATSTLGDYQIERLLGQSRLGAAYVARQISHGRTVMVTVFNFSEEVSISWREQFTARLIQEKTALVGLVHPNILPIYDFGEQFGNLYQAIAITNSVSPVRLLKQQGRFTPVQTLNILKQIAAGLDYAHSKGVVHGLLSLSNTLINDDHSVQIAGFGLRTMLEACGSRQDRQPQGYLFSSNGTFMGMPAYVSPERVQGQPIDARSDIYALGVILFELLTGSLPFNGDDPLNTALKRLQQPVPSVHASYPDIPEALDLIIGKALNLDPARRYQHAGDIAIAFERALQLLQEVEKTSTSRTGRLRQNAQNTQPQTANRFDEAENSSGTWQSMPPVVTGTMPAVPAGQSDSMAGFDPFAWWSATSASSKTSAHRKSGARTTVRLKSNTSRSRSQALHEDRRRLVGFIVAGTVTAGVFGVGGISFAHFVSSLKQSQSQIASVPTTAPSPTTPIQGNTPTTAPTQGTHKTPTPSKSPTPKPSPSATKSPQPSPTAQPTQLPTPTPTPPSHTGKVIGYTSQKINSAQNFTNPADGHGSLLIHLGNGNFVACERACTHEGVAVNYDSGQGKLVCPAHGAVFDPNNGFSHVSGPGNGPLPGVSIRVNQDGTITTG